jgi:hypothetical protein
VRLLRGVLVARAHGHVHLLLLLLPHLHFSLLLLKFFSLRRSSFNEVL